MKYILILLFFTSQIFGQILSTIGLDHNLGNNPQLVLTSPADSVVDFGTGASFSYIPIIWSNPSTVDLMVLPDYTYQSTNDFKPFSLVNDNSLVVAGGTGGYDAKLTPTADTTITDTMRFIVYNSTLTEALDSILISFTAVISGYSVSTLSAPVLAVTNSDNSLTIDWTSISGATSYDVYLSTNGSDYSLLANTTSSDYDYEGNFLFTYYLKAKAKNSSVESAYSNIISDQIDPSGDSVVYINSFASTGGDGSISTPYNEFSDVPNWGAVDVALVKGTFTDESTTLNGINGLIIAPYDSSARFKINYYANRWYTPSTSAFVITSSSNIDIRNAEIEARSWFNIQNSSYITVREGNFYHNSTDAGANCDWLYDVPIWLYNVDYSVFKNSSFKGLGLEYEYGDVGLYGDADENCAEDIFRIEGGSSYNLWDNNYVYGGDHSQFFSTGGFNSFSDTYSKSTVAHHNIWVNNVFDNPIHNIFNIFGGTYRSYIADNYFVGAGYGHIDPNGSNAITLEGGGGIFRNNIVKRSGKPTSTSQMAMLNVLDYYGTIRHDAFNWKVVNNTFDDNNITVSRIGIASTVQSYPSAMSYFTFENNSYVNNAITNTTGGRDILFEDATVSGYTQDTEFRNNYGDGTLRYNSSDNSWSAFNSAGYLSTIVSGNVSSFIANFADNTYEGSNLDTARLSYSILTGSSLEDAGTYLTTVTNTSGTTITVSDPYYFFDGFGLIDGDNIVFSDGSTTLNTSVTSVDYDNNQIVVSANNGITTGMYVYYEYSGAAPDIGAVEKGTFTTPTPAFADLYYTNLAKQTVTLNTTIALDGESLTAIEVSISPSADMSSKTTYSLGTLSSIYDNVNLTQDITGLDSLTTYYYQSNFTYNGYATYSDVESFTTLGTGTTWGSNIATNGDFETGALTNWTSSSADTWEISTTYAQDTYSGHLVEASSNEGAYYRISGLTDGDTLQISYQIYLTAGKIYVLGWNNRLKNYNTTNFSKNYNSTGTWITETVEVVFNNPTYDWEDLYFVYGGDGGAPNAYIDNLTVKIKQ